MQFKKSNYDNNLKEYKWMLIEITCLTNYITFPQSTGFHKNKNISANVVNILKVANKMAYANSTDQDFGLCWGFTAQSTQWGHVERGQFT